MCYVREDEITYTLMLWLHLLRSVSGSWNTIKYMILCMYMYATCGVNIHLRVSMHPLKISNKEMDLECLIRYRIVFRIPQKKGRIKTIQKES